MNSKDNILVDIYNLELTENSEQDKDKIIAFFRKYDPYLTKYLTAQDIENISQHTTMIGSDKEAIKVSTNAEVAGSLEWFEHYEGKSWFQTDETWYFYELWRLAKDIIKAYINNKPITQWELMRTKKLLDGIIPDLNLENKETGVRTGIYSVPEEIEIKKYKFMQGIAYKLSESKLVDGKSKSVLNLGIIKYKLFNEIISLLNGEIEIRKCAAEDCKKIFIPKILKQLYHSETCRARIAKRRERNKNSTMI